MTVATMLEIMADRDKTLSELAEEIPKYYMIKKKVSCKDRKAVMKHISSYGKR